MLLADSYFLLCILLLCDSVSSPGNETSAVGAAISALSEARPSSFLIPSSNSSTRGVGCRHNEQRLTVDIYGVPNSPPSCSVRIQVAAQASLNHCGATEPLIIPTLQYAWFLNGSLVQNDSYALTIEPNTYKCGDRVMVEVVANFDNLSANASQTIEFVIAPLVVIVDSTHRSVAEDENLRIDASQSYSPNLPSGVLNHHWSCLNLTLSTTTPKGISPRLQAYDIPVLDQPKNSTTPCGLTGRGAVFTVPSGVLHVGDSLLFTDEVSDGQQTAQIGVSVEVLAPRVPSIELVPVDDPNPSTSDHVRVRALITSPGGGNLSTEWRLFEKRDAESFAPVDLSVIPNLAGILRRTFRAGPAAVNGTGRRVALSIAIPPRSANGTKSAEWKGLNANTSHILRLIAKNNVGSSFADHQFRLFSTPLVGKVVVNPSTSIVALETVVAIGRSQNTTSTAAETHSSNHTRIRYGIKTLLVGNASRVVWSRSTTLEPFETLLPSAWPEPFSPCGERIGLSALMKICDDGGMCDVGETQPFVVGHALNITVVESRTVEIIRAKTEAGDVFTALWLLDVLRQELCNETVDSALITPLLEKLEDEMESSNDAADILDALDYVMRLSDQASPTAIARLEELLRRAKEVMGLTQLEKSPPVGANRRHRRDTALITTQSQQFANSSGSLRSVSFSKGMISETAASTLLSAYDLLVGKDQDVVKVYLANIQDILSSLCVQSDSGQLMQATGQKYTKVQAEELVPSSDDFLNTTFSVAGTKLGTVQFDQVFASTYNSWPCVSGLALCSQICMGTASTDIGALQANIYLQQFFFSSQYNSITLGQAVSDILLINFLDPISGQNLTLSNGAGLVVNVPLHRYVASNYYKCFLFTGWMWEDGACLSDDQAHPTADTTPNSFLFACRCHKVGILAVFTISPPAPIYYPPYNEIQLLFTMNIGESGGYTGSQLTTFVDTLSAASAVASQRFVALNSTVDMNNCSRITMKLRPAFRSDQQSNSYAMQAIRRVVDSPDKFIAFDDVQVISLVDFVVYRALRGDGNARRISLHIDHSYRDLVGNDSQPLATKWTGGMSTDMTVSPYRFKNPSIGYGVLFNFTITLPFDGETSNGGEVLSAEEMADWIQEQTQYNEIDLRDNMDQPLPIEQLNDDDITELVATQPNSTLTIILSCIVGAAIILSSFITSGLVLLKIRSNKLIESHNANMRTIDISQVATLNGRPFEPVAERAAGIRRQVSNQTASSDTIERRQE